VDESTTALRIIASTPVAVVFANRDGVIRIWNEGASKLLGYAPEQAIGHRVDLFIPPEYHELHWAGFDRAVACGHTRNPGEGLRLPAIHRTGDRIEIAGTFGIVFDEDGQAVGVAGLLTKAE
jgi:PAS domain S-box-containing protein